MSSTSSASPVSSSAPSQDIHGPATSSNLYLVTFLATLFLLLFVSCAIVLRSYILRRRYQRRLDEAMATGLHLAPRAPGSKRKRFGAKPKLYDTWLADGGGTWDHIKPLAAQPVFVKRKYKDAPPKLSTITAEAQAEQEFDELIANGIGSPSDNAPRSTTALLNQSTVRLRNFLRHPRRSNPATNPDLVGAETEGLTDNELPNNGKSATQMPPAPTGGYKVRVEMLQVAVLIAMPSQSRTNCKNAILDRAGKQIEEEDDDDEGESELPELLLGTTRLHYRQPKSALYANSALTPTALRQDLRTLTALQKEIEPVRPSSP
ncbi:hypothetical protein CPB84DRAFT_1843256 [Gymnopilus junonius]|uniref:Uncharacterized protein n=1 Tax=Gymnopilus junonius TaxID=109634 RepID=A0A9P5NW78_GYMJU|nr:hypothetical protein CPB84DRAFT_1843256 [Gymnopilus junonius]